MKSRAASMPSRASASGEASKEGPVEGGAARPGEAATGGRGRGSAKLEAADFEEQFGRISRLMRRVTGVALHSGKKEMVRARLGKRLRALGGLDFREYADLVHSDEGRGELETMVDLLTTNKTSFFREREHFEFLTEEMARGRLSAERGLRFWSAGCSSGEEAYSLAVCALAGLDRGPALRTRILATDICRDVLRTARAAVYPARLVEPVPEPLRRAWFEPVEPPRGAASEPHLRPVRDVRGLVRIARLNLLRPWPMSGPFDAILCRNVMIYFEAETRQRLVERFARLLRPGGFLIVGHSESLNGLDHTLRYCRPAVYRR